MTAQPSEKLLEGTTISHTIVLAGTVPTPSFGLYQPYYPLTEADFLRLQQSSPILSSMAGAAGAFCLSYALPILARFLVPSARGQAPAPTVIDAIVIGAAAVLAIALGLAGWKASAERKRVVQRIREHFLSNPGSSEVRVGK